MLTSIHPHDCNVFVALDVDKKVTQSVSKNTKAQNAIHLKCRHNLIA